MVIGFLGDHEGDQTWWTSGSDEAREGKWYWASSLTTVGEFIWNEGQPNEGTTDNCMYPNAGGQTDALGYDGACALEKNAICERK